VLAPLALGQSFLAYPLYLDFSEGNHAAILPAHGNAPPELRGSTQLSGPVFWCGNRRRYL
jgi:hypothetical protein